MKFICAALAAVAFADKSDFPKFDAFHADCAVSAQFNQVSCDSLYALMDNEIRTWDSDATSPSQGVYALKEEANDDYIWSTRLTLNKKYTDDQLFEFNTSGSGCMIGGKSRSQSVSYLDNDVNFCNLWNVYNGVGAEFTYSTGKCSGSPNDPATTCARY